MAKTETEKTETEPAEGTWWTRNCNGKRYYLKEVHNFLGRRYVWLHLENTNRCLHLPVKSVRKNYTQVDTTGMQTVQTSTVKGPFKPA